MLDWIFSPFRTASKHFIHRELGNFRFCRGIGWVGETALNGKTVELVFGSDGCDPTQRMIQSIEDIRKGWGNIESKVSEFVEQERLRPEWQSQEVMFPESISPRSVQVLWEDRPECVILEFIPAGNDFVWHVTLESGEPTKLGFDH